VLAAVDAAAGGNALLVVQIGRRRVRYVEDPPDGRQGLATKLKVNESEAGLIAP
jgi:hypothetical protein